MEPVKTFFNRNAQPVNLLTVSDFVKFAEWALHVDPTLPTKEKVKKALDFWVDKNGGAFIRINNGTLLTYKRLESGNLQETRYYPASWDWDTNHE